MKLLALVMTFAMAVIPAASQIQKSQDVSIKATLTSRADDLLAKWNQENEPGMAVMLIRD